MKLIRPLVIFSLAMAGISFAPPAQATTICPPGTYVSSYDSSICNSTPPGTFTASEDESQPRPCPLGKYQPFYGQTSCLNTPVGAANSQLRGTHPEWCDPGSFQSNTQAISCLPAAAGTFVSERGATSPTPCPTNPANATLNNVRTGNTALMQCFDFSGNSLVSPRASGTMDNHLKFDFYLADEIARANNLRLTFVNASNSSLVYQVVATANASFDGKQVTYSIGTEWINSNVLQGCLTACPGTAVTGIPLGTYNITVEARSLADSWISFSSNSVVITDTVTQVARAYVQGYAFIPLSGSIIFGLAFPESYLPGSVSIKISNRPYYLSPTATRIYQLRSGTLPLNVSIDLGGSGVNSDVASVGGADITQGQWWVSLSYRDAAGNNAQTDEWPFPILLTRACTAGSFSVNGIEACVQVPAGYQITYPSITAFSFESKAFSPTPCARGTYMPWSGNGGTGCILANPGNYVPEIAATSLIACPAGTYQPSSGQSSCVPASVNHFVADSGQASQTACPAGFIQPNLGRTSCEAIPVIPVVPIVQAPTPTVPIVCPALTFSTAAATSVADCKPRPCVVGKGKSATPACMLASVAQVLPAKAKVSIKMNRSFRTTCKVNKTRVRALKAGTCTVTMTVKPRKGKSVRYQIQVTGT